MNSPFFLGIFLILLRFAPVFFGQTILFGDNYSLMVPGKLFSAQWLAQGILPLWNPLLFAGIPWIGDVNQSILYPSTPLFLVFSPAVALNVTIISHQILTFVGMYFLAKQFVKQQWLMATAAILWTFSPQVTGSINNIATLQSISWFPWIIYVGLFATKKWSIAVFFPLVVLMQFAGGYPQHVLYSILSAVVLSAWMNRSELRTKSGLLSWVFKWSVQAVLVIGLTALLWMPFLETIKGSTRAIQSAAQAASGSLLPVELVKVVFPYIFDNPLAGMKWGPSWNKPPNVSLYFTWSGLLVAFGWLVSRKSEKQTQDWFLLSVSLLAIIFAMGENLPFFSLISQIPVLKDMRGVSTILMIPSLLIALWLAIQADRLKPSVEILQKITRIFLFLALSTAALYALQFFWFIAGWNQLDALLAHKISSSAFHTVERDQVIFASIIAFFSFVSLITSGIVFAFARKKYSVVLVLVAIEMMAMTQGHFRYGPNSTYSVGEPYQTVQAVLRGTDLENYRVLTRNYNAPYSDFGAYYDALTVRQPFSDSYIDEQELRSYGHLRRMRDGATPDWNVVFEIPIINGYTTLLPLSMHQEFVASEKADASINDLPVILTTDPALQKWSNRYYVVDRWFPTYGEVFPEKILASNDQWIVYELPNVLSRFRFDTDEPLQMETFAQNPNTITFGAVRSATQSAVIIADRFDKNWQVSVNGAPVSLENWQGMRRFSVPEGKFEVMMQYQPKSFYDGIAISTGTLMAIGLLFWGSKKLNRKTSR